MNFELTLEEINAVLYALGQLPMSQVEPLVNKIREQAKGQIPATEPVEPPVAE